MVHSSRADVGRGAWVKDEATMNDAKVTASIRDEGGKGGTQKKVFFMWIATDIPGHTLDRRWAGQPLGSHPCVALSCCPFYFRWSV